MAQNILFTDGACLGNPGPGGWGFILATEDGRIIERGGHESSTTNNRMELMAVLHGLAQITQGSVTVFLDSTYVLKGATEWRFGWRNRGWTTSTGEPVANTELWQDLDDLLNKLARARVELKFQHVLGHAGIPGNERVDAIASAFARRESPPLFDGKHDNYDIDLSQIKPTQTKDTKKSTTQKGKPIGYISFVDDEFLVHADWSSCERRVHGRTGARYRKVFSEEEIASYRQQWGAQKRS